MPVFHTEIQNPDVNRILCSSTRIMTDGPHLWGTKNKKLVTLFQRKYSGQIPFKFDFTFVGNWSWKEFGEISVNGKIATISLGVYLENFWLSYQAIIDSTDLMQLRSNSGWQHGRILNSPPSVDTTNLQLNTEKFPLKETFKNQLSNFYVSEKWEKTHFKTGRESVETHNWERTPNSNLLPWNQRFKPRIRDPNF